MHFFTPTPLLRQVLLAVLALVAGGLGSGCQSSRPGFSFQPAPGRMATENPADNPLATTTTTTTTWARSKVPAVAPTLVHAPLRLHQRTFPAPRAAVSGTVGAARPLAPPLAQRLLAQRRPWLARPRAQAEVGLGTTVLGVLGLVALPVGLLGLLLGGGLAWGIVAGLGAVAVLVAYLDPFWR